MKDVHASTVENELPHGYHLFHIPYALLCSYPTELIELLSIKHTMS